MGLQPIGQLPEENCYASDAAVRIKVGLRFGLGFGLVLRLGLVSG